MGDYLEKNTKIYQGFGVNLAPLSVAGIDEIKTMSKGRKATKLGYHTILAIHESVADRSDTVKGIGC